MKDFLGQELAVGDYVVGMYSENTTPAIFQVLSFTPMKCRLIPLYKIDPARVSTETIVIMKFGRDLLKLDAGDVEESIVQAPLDALLRPLSVGDYVCGSEGGYVDPVIFEIVSFAPRSAIIKPVYTAGSYCRSATRLTSDLSKIDPKLVTMRILTGNNE